MGSDQGTLTEGNVSEQLTSSSRSAAFQTETFFYKTTYLNEEVNRTEPFPSVWVPWSNQSYNGLAELHCHSKSPGLFKSIKVLLIL